MFTSFFLFYDPSQCFSFHKVSEQVKKWNSWKKKKGSWHIVNGWWRQLCFIASNVATGVDNSTSDAYFNKWNQFFRKSKTPTFTPPTSQTDLIALFSHNHKIRIYLKLFLFSFFLFLKRNECVEKLFYDRGQTVRFKEEEEESKKNKQRTDLWWKHMETGMWITAKKKKKSLENARQIPMAQSRVL